MKVLFFNWIDYHDPQGRGGGVSIYQRNVVEAMRGAPDVECLFLSSGIAYDLIGRTPRWARCKLGSPTDRESRFEIVNSGVLAPAHHSFGDTSQLFHKATEDVFFDFLERNGPFDIVHFNNLEGLPVTVLALKERHPETKVILTLHNYYPFCPQVNLWHHIHGACTDFDDGRQCVNCLPHRIGPRAVRQANAVTYRLGERGVRPGTVTFDRAVAPAMRFARDRMRDGYGSIRKSGPVETRRLGRPEHFAERRAAMVAAINRYCDHVLCVSARTTEIARRYGIEAPLLRTSYIGTRHAGKFSQTAPKDSLIKPDGTLTLAYLGYARHQKGFFFLLDALEAMPDVMAAKIHLLIGSKLDQPKLAERLNALSRRFASLRHVDGYRHVQLDAMLEDVDLGVILVLWEDTLPQVAIEMHCRHIPLLASEMGGARELGNTPDFVFASGSTDALIAKLGAALDGRLDLAEYWRNAVAPRTMAEHLRELRAVYSEPVSQSPRARRGP